MGNLSVDQRVTGESDEEFIHMSRPLGSMYDFEYGMTCLLTDNHYDFRLDDEFDWDDFEFGEMYR